VKKSISKAAAFALAAGAGTGSVAAYASESVIEEIVVTARQQAETLQDVPVTIAAFTEEDLDRYNITNLVDAGKMVPNMLVAPGGSGNGTNLRLRGIGSSSISAAFDQSVAINLDGVVVNRGRFIHNSYLDMGQLEILKGPQSLYFGKSATAGVISITTNDPGDEFEFQLAAGVETEHDGIATEMIISGPITDTFGARLAVGYLENDELIENYAAKRNPDAATVGADDWFGDESLNARLTLVWNPTDTFSARLKYNYSEYESDGGIMWSESLCPDGSSQPTGIPTGATVFRQFQAVDDCRLNGNNYRLYLNPGLRDGLPQGYNDGQQGLEQETDFVSLQVDWDVSESLTLTSVTGWVDLDHWELDDYSGGATVFGGLHNNVYESLSQEFRLASNFDSPINFQAGVFWQEMEQEFNAFQYAFNLPLIPYFFGDFLAGLAGSPDFSNYAEYVDFVQTQTGAPIVAPPNPASGIIGPDPFTGNEYDYNKDHFLDTDVLSAFVAIYWDINERTELTFGARYTEEEKDGYILIPYLHAGAGLFGFGAPERIDGLEFEDDNISPEVAINYYITDDISVFAAYKEGFKSGGIDNSALPTASLNPDNNGGDFSFLNYDSEEASGYEIGMKANLLDGAMRLNATVFDYDYDDLQVQLFDSSNVQFTTFNASSLRTRGAEVDLLWQTRVEGLSVRGALAFTDTEYTDDFFNQGEGNPTRENLKGEELRNNAEVTGYIGTTYDFALGDALRLSISADARYSDDYGVTDTLNPITQDSFWLLDASVSLYTADERHSFNVIGRNLSDEYYAVSGQSIPGRISPGATSQNQLDQGINTPMGRTILLQYRFTY
jgi:iron complex outermembrane receptor protein